MTVLKISMELFVQEITALVKSDETGQTSFLDAAVHYAEKNNMEIESVADMIRKIPVIKSYIQEEAQELNLIEKTTQLPL